MRSRSLNRFRRKPHGPIGLLGRADQALLRLLRTRGHDPVTETTFKALGHVGEFAAVWVAIGLGGAAADPPRRKRWLLGAATGPAAVVANYAVKVAVGRERPLIEDHPALARAPSKLSFPSAHATSSFAAATAYGRVEPRARLPVYALAGAICLSRPYLGMHYPSDVVAGIALGTLIGGLVPAVGERTLEERMLDFVSDRARQDAEAEASDGAAEPELGTPEAPH
ncbi:MAG: phosphatase PAP2 family protein [Actinomycetota bacterium]|nr:phosphatase PAP2 family protein [Actinomycetota bacterium]